MEIKITSNTVGSSISMCGTDISHLVTEILLKQKAGFLPLVKLKIDNGEIPAFEIEFDGKTATMPSTSAIHYLNTQLGLLGLRRENLERRK